MRYFDLKGIFLFIVLTSLFSGVQAQEDERVPNFVFILADDLRHDQLGYAGHPFLRTPVIDKLADEGVRFKNMFVTSSICMASRASIFTGLTETGHGFTGHGKPPANLLLSEDVDTSFPFLLRKAGYRTGFFGKQHVKFEEGTGAALDRMFERYESIYREPYFKQQHDGSLRHTAELIGDRSVEFLASQSEDQPFLLYISFNIAHAEDGDKRPGIGHFPWPKAEDGLYDDIQPPFPRLGDVRYFEILPDFLQASLNRERWYWRWDTSAKYTTNMRAYYRMVSGMDRIIGRVLDQLEKQGLSENTVVIFTADNGYYMGDRGLAGKWSHFEESLRVPLVIHDPRLPQEQRNRLVESMALNIDLPATMLDLAGLPVPRKYQGSSLRPLTLNDTPSDWREDFFCEHHLDNPAIPKWRGVRGRRYTYACYYEQDPVHEFLYDLDKDPTQYHNLAGNPEFAEQLKQIRERCNEYIEAFTRPEVVAARLENTKEMLQQDTANP